MCLALFLALGIGSEEASKCLHSKEFLSPLTGWNLKPSPTV